MTVNKQYAVTKKIKLHTKPLREEEITKTGRFLRETSGMYVFDGFRVRKANVVRIKEMTGGEHE